VNSEQQLLFEDATDSAFGDLLKMLGVRVKPGWPDDFGEALRAMSLDSKAYSPRVLSLFAGAGGLDIGFHDAGFTILEMVEIEQRFVQTLVKNTKPGHYLSGSHPICIDIREYEPSIDLQIDFIIGGPPCQTFSAAGRRAAGVRGTTDDRGTLFQEYVRILRQLKPKGFLFENVYGITGADGGDAWQEITAAFRSAGYEIEYRVLDSADFGVPQHRERMFIVGTRVGGFKFPRPTHGPDSKSKIPFYSAGLAVAKISRVSARERSVLGGRYGHLLEEIPPGLNYSYFTEEMGHPTPVFAWRSKFSDFLYKADPDRPVRTIKAQGGQYTGPFHWDSRPFTVEELKRLQTFPDAYEIVGNRQVAIHQIGNSVPPQIARVLAICIRQQIFADVSLPPMSILEPRETLGFRHRKRSLTDVYRRTASEAIKKQSGDSSRAARNPSSRTFYCDLVSGLVIRGSNLKQASFRVRQRILKTEWVFESELRPGHQIGSLCAEGGFEVVIVPTKVSGWALPVKRVRLIGRSTDERLLTLGWKAFERVVTDSNIRADLVQLCGYYQYVPAFVSNLILPQASQSWKWKALTAVHLGVSTREILTSNDIANRLEITVNRVTQFASWLKEMGYEVRNHSTNPQITNGSYLIPYAFPTLSTSSVQFRKTL